MDLSIVIPAYNCENYIVKCIQKIKAEISSDVEIIIVDDGSTDNTFSICSKFTSKNIFVYRQENQGVSGARNKGIDLSCGKFIMFVDADDTLVPGWFHYLQQYFESTYDIIYFGANYEDHSYTKEDIVKNIFGIPSSKKINYLPSVCSKMFQRKFLIDNGIRFNNSLINGEDLLFSLNCFLQSSTYKFIKAPIYNYFINNSSCTHSFNESFIESNNIFLKETELLMHQMKIKQSLIDDCLRFSFVQSVIILLMRISYIEDKRVLQTKLNLFDTPYILKGFQKYKLKVGQYGFKRYILYMLLSKKLQKIAFKVLMLKKNKLKSNYYKTI